MKTILFRFFLLSTLFIFFCLQIDANTYKNAPLDFSSDPQAKYFHTRLMEAAKQKPNFAHHYIVTSWGCGMFCLTIAIIDTQTGKIYFPEINNPTGQWDKYLIGWQYKTPHVNSDILIVTAQLTTKLRSDPTSLDGPYRYQTLHYQWKNNQLKLVEVEK